MDYKTFQVVSKCKVQNISENHTCSFQIKIFNSSLCVGFLHKNQTETHFYSQTNSEKGSSNWELYVHGYYELTWIVSALCC